MTAFGEDGSGHAVKQKLPRRDLFILPLISLVTISVCLFAAQVTAAHFFADGGPDICTIDDARLGFRYRPNCTSYLKAPEGPLVTNSYNDCGYRTKQSCGPTPKGTIRIALLGASLSAGLNVDYDQTFATRTAAGLSAALGRPVEVQNLGRPGISIIDEFRQVDEALALKPDLLILAIGPYDIEELNPDELANRYKPVGAQQLEQGHTQPGLLERTKLLLRRSPLAVAGEHFYYQDTAAFARVYLNYGDKADYLRTPFSPLWEKRMNALEVVLAEIKQKADAAHVPFVLVVIPSLAEASLLKMQNLPPGVDPYAFPKLLEARGAQDGIQVIDTVSAFKDVPQIYKVFYLVDGHINAQGHAVVSRVMVRELLAKQTAALLGHNEAQAQAAPEQGR
jgi:hypothetical protein